MPSFKRLVAQVHDIEADTPAQADEIARIRADAVNAGMRVLGHGTAWGVTVLDADSEEGGLTDILQDAYLLDEIDDNPERNPHTGYRALDETIVFEKLLAWRDAAVRAATADLLMRINNARTEIARLDARATLSIDTYLSASDVCDALAAVETHLVDPESR